MNEKRILKSKSFLLIAVLDLVLIIAILFLMNFVQYLLNKDVRINLTEIVTQNKDVITSKLDMEINNLELDSKQISERFEHQSNMNFESMKAIFLEYAEQKSDLSLVWAMEDGRAFSGEGKEIEVSGRGYFKLGIKGVRNISDRMISRVNGEDVFVICVPLSLNGKIIGTIQKQYTPQQMYSLCSVSLFSDKGSTYIINSQGYILICSEKSEYNRESDNYYRIIYPTDAKTSKQLEQDVKNNKSGFMEANIEGNKVFFAYTPIEGIYDWYLISSIPTNAVSPNANTVIKLFYFVLFTLALLFAFTGIYYLMLKKNQQLSLERIAFVDTVTLGNSFTKFRVDLNNIFKNKAAKQFCICTLDIDNFKYINNFYGFDLGDKILKNIYLRYQKKINADERISRVNADHFVMLLEDVSKERLNDLIELECTVEGIRLYFSAGIYKIKDSDSAECINLMIDKASAAAAKGKGKHIRRVEFYSEELFKEATHMEQLKRALEEALENDEIIPFFQPKVNINTGELVGAEALARWRTRKGKLISPNEFIPVCEQTGLIISVDIAIFEKTLQFIKSNIDKGIKCVPISVNFSRLHLANKDFVSRVLARLEKYQVPPELIELELTETVIFDNFKMMNDFIKELHSKGLRISMDDFGTGNSSLSMLKDVEIDVLKIDRGFLLGTESSSRQKTIFGTIVEMASKLNIKVVVEGVETIENINIMKEFNCDCAQGYFYAKPMDEEAFGKVYKEGYVCKN